MNTKLLALVFAGLTLTACSHTPRTKYSDPHMRIAVWPNGIDTGNYVKIQQALVHSGKFIVVDRGNGLAAIKQEQEALHITQSDRFADPEKFAHFGKLLGVGGVVVAHTQCATKGSFWTTNNYSHCQQYLEIVNSNTGEVMASAEGEAETRTGEDVLAPEWEGTVSDMIAQYPAVYEPNKDTQVLIDYKAQSQEEAQRMKERQAQNAAQK